MPSGSTLALFTTAALALLLVPGPSVLYIVTRSVDQGRAAGLVSVAGIHLGSVVHVLAAAFGVSVVLARSAEAFTIVKFAGAIYFVALGLRRLFGPLPDEDSTAANARTLRRTFLQGTVVNILNPKTALFFLAFIPQFVDADKGSPVLQTLFFGVCFIALGMCTDSAYALAASSLGGRMRSRAQRRRLERAGGVVYLGLGMYAALAHQPVERA